MVQTHVMAADSEYTHKTDRQTRGVARISWKGATPEGNTRGQQGQGVQCQLTAAQR